MYVTLTLWVWLNPWRLKAHIRDLLWIFICILGLNIGIQEAMFSFFFFRYLECVDEKNLDLVLYLSIALFFKFQSHNSVLYKELARLLYSNFIVSFPRNTLLSYFDFAISYKSMILQWATTSHERKTSET